MYHSRFIQAGCALAVALILAAAPAAAASRNGLRPDGICTMDLNRWGQASRCSCGPGTTYDERAGLCLDGEATEPVMVQGTVIAGMAAIGGETTGLVIETSDGTVYELIATLDDQQKLSEKSGMWFEVEGEEITIDSVEKPHRAAIIADQIRVLE